MHGLKQKEKDSFGASLSYATSFLDKLPANLHWRVYLELADIAKRSNKAEEARRLFQRVLHLNPFNSKGWLEYAKVHRTISSLLVKIL